MSSSLISGTNGTSLNVSFNSIFYSIGTNVNWQNIVEFLLFTIIASIILSTLYSVFKYSFDYLFRKGKNRNIQNYLKNLFPFNKLYGEFLNNKFKNLYNIYIYVITGLAGGTIVIGFLMLCCYALFIYVYYIIQFINYVPFAFKDSYIIFPMFMNITYLVPFALYRIFINKKVEINEEYDLSIFSFSPLSKICCILGSTLSCFYLVYFYSYFSYCKYLSLDPNTNIIQNLITIFQYLYDHSYLIIPHIIGLFYGYHILYIINLKLNEFFIEQRKLTINKEIGKFSFKINKEFEGKIEDIDNNVITLNEEGTHKIILWNAINSLERVLKLYNA